MCAQGDKSVSKSGGGEKTGRGVPNRRLFTKPDRFIYSSTIIMFLGVLQPPGACLGLGVSVNPHPFAVSALQ
jgi:hypothetical protein